MTNIDSIRKAASKQFLYPDPNVVSVSVDAGGKFIRIVVLDKAVSTIPDFFMGVPVVCEEGGPIVAASGDDE